MTKANPSTPRLIALLAVLVLSASFWASRAAADIQALGVKLVGVVAFEDKPKALVSIAGIAEDVLVGEGDLIEGYTIRRIDKDQMDLARDGKTETLSLQNIVRLQAPDSAKEALVESGDTLGAPGSGEVRRLVSSNPKKQLATAVPIRSSQTRIARSEILGSRPSFERPLKTGYVSSEYGLRIHPIRGRAVGGTRTMHNGVDVAAPTGTPVYAAAEGTVLVSGWSWAKGNYIEIQHRGGYSTAYFHLSRRGVVTGQKVSSGQYIGAVGNTGVSTGPHLHFEVLINGSNVNPANYIRSLRSR